MNSLRVCIVQFTEHHYNFEGEANNKQDKIIENIQKVQLQSHLTRTHFSHIFRECLLANSQCWFLFVCLSKAIFWPLFHKAQLCGVYAPVSAVELCSSFRVSFGLCAAFLIQCPPCPVQEAAISLQVYCSTLFFPFDRGLGYYFVYYLLTSQLFGLHGVVCLLVLQVLEPFRKDACIYLFVSLIWTTQLHWTKPDAFFQCYSTCANLNTSPQEV